MGAGMGSAGNQKYVNGFTSGTQNQWASPFWSIAHQRAVLGAAFQSTLGMAKIVALSSNALFSAEQNLAIDKVVPVSASVKAKLGRGGSYED